MSRAFVLVAMLFGHVLDDYTLQSACLVQLKQKRWWEENEPEPEYRHDYAVALIMHAISWSFCIMFPIAWYLDFNVSPKFVLVFLVNVLTHAVVDDLKANRHRINLIADQTIHMFQIIATFLEIIFMEVR